MNAKTILATMAALASTELEVFNVFVEEVMKVQLVKFVRQFLL